MTRSSTIATILAGRLLAHGHAPRSVRHQRADAASGDSRSSTWSSTTRRRGSASGQARRTRRSTGTSSTTTAGTARRTEATGTGSTRRTRRGRRRSEQHRLQQLRLQHSALRSGDGLPRQHRDRTGTRLLTTGRRRGRACDERALRRRSASATTAMILTNNYTSIPSADATRSSTSDYGGGNQQLHQSRTTSLRDERRAVDFVRHDHESDDDREHVLSAASDGFRHESTYPSNTYYSTRRGRRGHRSSSVRTRTSRGGRTSRSTTGTSSATVGRGPQRAS